MSTDSIRLIFTYVIALVVLVGSFLLLWQKLPELTPEALLAVITTALGFVLGFVFNRESTVGGARAAERAFNQGQGITTEEGK